MVHPKIRSDRRERPRDNFGLLSYRREPIRRSGARTEPLKGATAGSHAPCSNDAPKTSHAALRPAASRERDNGDVDEKVPIVEVVIEIPRGSFLKRGSTGHVDFVSPLPL